MPGDRRAFRAQVLAQFGARGPVVEELLTYNDNTPTPPDPSLGLSFPLPPQPHLAAWEGYAADAKDRSAWEVLRQRLPQLCFPVREGISQTEAYRSATRKGVPPETLYEATGLALQSPNSLRLWIHMSLAGPVPVLCTADRADFCRLVQALSCRNEPEPVPASMGACLVSGFNNWDRVRHYRERWARQRPAAGPAAWADEFRRLLPHKALYQDLFLILSEGNYSNVAPADMGLSVEDWQRFSQVIRLEHECTHYLTLRLFSSARPHALDELLADYAGIAACGRYRADWLLRFAGLEGFPPYRAGGRLENYRGQPPLSDAAFQVMGALVKTVAESLERWDARWVPRPSEPRRQADLLIALYQSTLEELAAPDADAQLGARLGG
jgi:hypothetical protein